MPAIPSTDLQAQICAQKLDCHRRVPHTCCMGECVCAIWDLEGDLRYMSSSSSCRVLEKLGWKMPFFRHFPADGVQHHVGDVADPCLLRGLGSPQLAFHSTATRRCLPLVTHGLVPIFSCLVSARQKGQ